MSLQFYQDMNSIMSNSSLSSYGSSFSGSPESTLHITKDHFTDSFRSICKLQQATTMCDLKLIVGECTIHAHKLILAACSPYFLAMFSNDVVEKNSSEIEIHEVDPHAVQMLVDYLYTSRIMINENNVQVLLPAASLLQITVVRDACSSFLMQQLHPANCLGIKRFADIHSCQELFVTSHQYSLRNFVDVSDTEEFLVLSFEDICELTKSEEINAEHEEQIYIAVIKWLHHDLKNRRKHASDLLACVRLPLISREFLMSNVESEEIVQADELCKDLLIEAMKYHLLPEKRSQLQTARTRERKSDAMKPIIFVIGGGSLFTVHNECEIYDASTGQWYGIASMITRRSRCGVASIQGNLYAVGGYDGSNDLAAAEFYNPRVNRWTPISAMGTKRSCLGACDWNGLLYVAGGYDGASCLNSVERYDPLTLTWASVASMTIRRRYLKIAVLDGMIYAIGGYDGSIHMSSVEKFNPEANEWQSAPNMISRRSNCGVAVLDGMIYACGGSDGASWISSVERFNPKRNLWEAVSSMHTRRSSHDVVALDGYLYAMGGSDGSTSLESVERYDSKSNRWTLITSMTMRRTSVAATVLEMAKFKSA